MADFLTMEGLFLITHLVRICTMILGRILGYELFTGEEPIRYWIFVLIHLSILILRVFGWAIGIAVE